MALPPPVNLPTLGVGSDPVAVRDEAQSAAMSAAGIDRVFNLFDDAAEQATHKVCEALLQERVLPSTVSHLFSS